MPVSSVFDCIRRPQGLLTALALLVACGPQVEIETDTTTGSSTSPEPTGTTPEPTDVSLTDPTVDPDGTTEGPGPTQRAVDILFVIDNSGSMSEEQANLVTGIESLVGLLDAAEPPVDYRIAVTTTDNGNPWCGQTSPEGGSLRASSCRSRPDEFVFNGAIMVDAFDEACADVCSLDALGIDDGASWIEVQRTAGTDNVGGAVVENLRCMLPQGIDGCGFEQHLESLWKALRRSTTDGDAAFGFLREGALPAIIIVTDEVDCSYNAEWEAIFLPEGNRVFWSDPDAASPTSAVCWNAGVSCNGDSCSSVNLDIDGSEVDDASAEDRAVLRPVSRYTDIVSDVGGYVFAIHGVNGDGSVTYQPSLDDPQFQNDFGIGPGCQSENGRAIPPVRERELVEAISGPGNLSSICAGDLSSALTTFGEGILSRLP